MRTIDSLIICFELPYLAGTIEMTWNKLVAFGLAAMALIVIDPSRAKAANLVTNGSFEASDPAGGKDYFAGNVSGWSGGANLTFLAAPGTADDPGLYLAVYGPFPATSPDGGNFILADGDPGYSGAFWQTITGLTVGQQYVLSFYQAAGQQINFTGPTTEQWQVSFGADTQSSPLFSLPEAGVGPWEKVSMTFTATSESQILSFLAVGTPNGAPPISFLDGVELNAVPEPSTLSMIVVGALGMGFARLRRRAQAAAV